MVLFCRHDTVAIVRVFTTTNGRPNKQKLSRRLELIYAHAAGPRPSESIKFHVGARSYSPFLLTTGLSCLSVKVDLVAELHTTTISEIHTLASIA